MSNILYRSTVFTSNTVVQTIKADKLESLGDYTIYIDYECDYKLYKSDVFKNILSDDGIEGNAIANSLSICGNFDSIIRYISEKDSELLFNFVTFDEKFIIKKIPKHEQRVFLRDKLAEYYDRVMDNSFLQHIYGVFKLIIKGKYYRLTLVENNQAGYISRGSISLSSINSGRDLVYEYEESLLEDKFYLDIDLKADFRETLEKDLEYLMRAGIRSCKIFIDILSQTPDSNRKIYSGLYQDNRAYLSLRIFDVVYTKFNKKFKKVRKMGIEMIVNQGTLSNIESMIRSYIS